MSRGIAGVLFAIMVVVVAALAVATLRPPNSPSSPPQEPPQDPPPESGSDCPRSVGLCVERGVTRVIDGDTLEVEGDVRIRLVLVDAPELTEPGGLEARDYLISLCLGKRAIADEDDDQIGDDPYGRLLAVVICGGTNANAAMIASGHAETYRVFCSSSEFGSQEWTGCSSSQPPPQEENCHSAYPDVCIPPPPPDLNCQDVAYTNFRVLPPDPHLFDYDLDGIGCER